MSPFLMRDISRLNRARLVEALRERVVGEVYAKLECRCSSNYQNSALYPVIEHLQRLLQLQRDDSPEEKLSKLERVLEPYGFCLPEVVPLFATPLSVPFFGRYSPLSLTPQKQKQKTLEALLTWLLNEAEEQATLLIWEDLQWADPSTLEFLGLLLNQTPTARLLILLTYRPDFSLPWTVRSPMTQITLNR